MWCPLHEKGPYAISRQLRPRSACSFRQANYGLCCPHKESMDTVVYVNELSSSDCTDAHADLAFTVNIWHKSPFPTLGITLDSKPCYEICTIINWDRQALANSVDPDQMPQNAASDQGLHCLPYIQQYYSHIKWILGWTISNFNPSPAEPGYVLPLQTV